MQDKNIVTTTYVPPMHRSWSFLGFGLMVVSAILLALPESARIAAGIMTALIGSIALWIALSKGLSLPTLALSKQSSALSRSIWHWVAAITGIGMLACLAEINGRRFYFSMFRWTNIHTQMWLFVVGIGLLAWGLGGGRLIRDIRFSMTIGRHGKILLFILISAFLLRFIALDSNMRWLIDEAQAIDQSLFIKAVPTQQILHPMNGDYAPYPWIYAYIRQIGVGIFGQNLVGLRVASSVVGTLTVLATYGLANELFDRKTALLSAIVLAVFPPHIHFSRLSLYNSADGLWGTLAIMFLVRALKTNTRMNFVLSGVFLGLTHYFFEGARLFFTPFIFLVLIFGIIFWYSWFKERWRGLIWMWLTVILITAPLYYTLVSINAPLTQRLATSGRDPGYWLGILAPTASSHGVQQHFAKIINSFLTYITLPDSTLYYGGQTGLIIPPLVPFFMMGMVYTLWHRRTPIMILILWISVMSLAKGIFIRDPGVTHFILVFPALALGIAVGMRLFWEMMRPQTSSQVQLMQFGLILLLMSNIGYYFSPQLDSLGYQMHQKTGQPNIDEALVRSAGFPAGTRIYVIGDYEFSPPHAHSLITFVNDTVFFKAINRTEWPELLRDLSSDNQYAFYFAPDDEVSVTYLYEKFDTIQGPIYGNSPHLLPQAQFVLYYLSSEGNWGDIAR